MRSHKLSVIASHMINVHVYIALMGFISVLYGIGILCIDEEKLDAVKRICAERVLWVIVWNSQVPTLTFAGWGCRCGAEELGGDEMINDDFHIFTLCHNLKRLIWASRTLVKKKTPALLSENMFFSSTSRLHE